MLKNDPIIKLINVQRSFMSGETTVHALKNINLSIHKGEMVAIIGASGSGKSTLMNILGCLDRPSAGSYHIAGQNTNLLKSDELSQLRLYHFGFIFQRYHLLKELTVLKNTEVPAIYAEQPSSKRKKQAKFLLKRLGIEEKSYHQPNQLSGGQQQRVSIARALINNAEIILADEPTGALDKKSSEEVIQILTELHEEGRTIIIVTHNLEIAKKAARLIEISDGTILSDSFNFKTSLKKDKKQEKSFNNVIPSKKQKKKKFFHSFTQLFEAFCMALLSMTAHRMRTFLTMLGVIIGIAAVVSMVALGNGTQQKILENINRFGTNTLTIFAGKSMADVRAAKVTTLVDEDAKALLQEPYVKAVAPMVATTTIIRHGTIVGNTSISGVGNQFFTAEGVKLIKGRLFDNNSILNRSLELILEKETANTLFPSGENPIGQIILLGKTAARICGIVETQRFGPGNNTLSVYLPYTTVQTRFLGNTTVRFITVLLAENANSHVAESAVKKFLIMRHGTEDFFIRNSEEFLEQVTESTHVLTILVASIALISLFVGGIGVMNIMLVSVSERTNEIGLRMAIGACRHHILQQFLVESVLVCLIGGALGVSLGFLVGSIFDSIQTPFKLIYSSSSIITAFMSSTLVGMIFGYLPARNASRLDPIVALARA
ncbi:MAG: macrolide transport system ATP-binding/permease protein [Candidatus Tokpelaia sp. JSC161]|jgi:macrolide transport system ATP-binding/permease protein|nr:MAG: macrolide transport system ATP-binding/permease protein [Candidatus Tokpelaia sp. JSC161]